MMSRDQWPDVSVVIPARNAASTIGAQLDALIAQAPAQRAEIVVVDNASTDTTAALVEERQGGAPFLRLLRCEQVGANAARNAGVREARSDRILLCDADDVVADDWIASLAGGLVDHDVVGGSLETERLNPPFLVQVRNPARVRMTTLPQAVAHIPYVISCNMGFRREAFDAIDGFDVAFRGGAEEVDFCIRVQAAGYTLTLIPDALVHLRLRPDLRSLMRQSYGYAVGTSQLLRKGITIGLLPAQSRRTQAAMFKVYWRRLTSAGNLTDRAGRWRFAIRAAWIAGSFTAAPRTRVLV